MLSFLAVLLCCVCTSVVQAQGPTSIFIDTLSEYSSLSPCAKQRMSAIIRAQSSGCGDKGALTSFGCFCSTSSSAFDDIISTAVASQCASNSDPDAQVTSALGVFSDYCALGTRIATTATSTTTSTPTPAPAATSSTVTPTSTSLPVKTSRRKSGLSGGAIAGIVIGVLAGVALLGAAAFFFWRQRRSKATATTAIEMPAPVSELPAVATTQELSSNEKNRGDTMSNQPRAELDAPST